VTAWKVKRGFWVGSLPLFANPRLVAAGLVIAIAGLSYAIHRWQAHPVPFDRRLWSAETRLDDDRNWRCRMLDDIVRRHIRVGMPLDEVLAKLGPSEPVRDGTRAFLRYPILTQWSYRWNGASDSLFVYFDHDRATRFSRESHDW
jgi:hypothetical protein